MSVAELEKNTTALDMHFFAEYEGATLIEITEKDEAEALFNSDTEECMYAGKLMDRDGMYAELWATKGSEKVPRVIKFCRVMLMFE